MGAAPSLAQIRQNFFKTAVLRSQKIAAQANPGDGGTVTFKLPKAGFGAFVLIRAKGNVVVSGAGGSVALSNKAPYNLFNRVVFEDYLGNVRVSCSGYKLYQREISTKHAFDPSNAVDSQSYSAALVESSVGAGSGAVGTYAWNVPVIVPIAVHQNTTEGSFPFTVPSGENTITITMNTFVGANNDNVVKQTTAGFTFDTTGLKLYCTYYYWDVPKGTVLPTPDFQLVHELREIRESDNLSAGNEKTFDLPTGRTYLQIIQDIVLNDAADTSDVSNIRFIVDGNTPMLDEDTDSYLYRIRRTYGRDWPTGMFHFDFWNHPWNPAQYGSLQTGLTLDSTATTTGNTYTSILTESIYQLTDIVASN